jgi:YD repeat-containing protein
VTPADGSCRSSTRTARSIRRSRGPGRRSSRPIDRANRRTDVTYTRAAGAEDLVETVELPEARSGRGRARTTFRYDADGDLVEATDSLGVITERLRSTKDGLQGLILTETRRAAGMTFPPPEERFQYDDMGHVVEHVGPEGETTRWTYDDLDRMTSVTGPDGTTQRWVWSRTTGLLERVEAPGGASISYAYDAEGQVASETDPDGTTTYRRDVFGDVVDEQRGTEGWSRPRDALGRVTGVFQRSVALGSTMPTFLGYDAVGNVLREECHVPGGQVELTETRLRRVRPDRVRPAADGPGRPGESDERPSRAALHLHPLRAAPHGGGRGPTRRLRGRGVRPRRARPRDPDPAGADPGGPFLEEELDHDLAGQLTTQRGDIAPLATTVVRTRARTVATVERDPLGRAVRARDTRGEVVQEVERDRSGRVVVVRAPDSSGQLVPVQERRFDRRTGQLDEVIDERGRSLRLFYDGAGRLARTVDPLGGEELREFDLAGRVTRVARLGADGTSEVVERRYTPEGWLAEEAQVEVGRRSTTRYQHDARGRLVRRVDPLGQVTTWVHDDRDQIVERTTPRGTTKFSYDSLGRLVRTSAWNGDWVEVRWDLAGRPLREENAEFAQDYAWGPWSDVERITTTEKRSGRARSVALDYDEFGLLEEVTDPEGVVTRHVHDSESRIVELHQGGVLRGRFGRDTAGRITTWQTPAGEQRREYDGTGRLLRQRSGRPAHAIEYAYDALGRRERAEYQHLGLSIAWTYDGLSRLTSERVTDVQGSTLHHEQLAWDGRGNRLWRARNGVREDYRYDAFNQLEELRGVELRELPAASATSTSTLDSSTVADRAIDGRKTVASADGFVSASVAADHTLTIELQGVREVAVIDLELPTDHGLPRSLKVELRDAIGSWRDADVLTYLGSRPLATSGSGGPATPGVVPAQAALRLVLRPVAATAMRITQPQGAAPLAPNPNHPEALAIAELRALAAIPRAETFQYDGNGNLLQAEARTFEWDAEDRLLAVREPGVVDRAFAWGPTGLLLREEDRQGRTETGHVYLNEELLASYDAQGAPTGKVLRGPNLDRQLGAVPYPGGVAGEARYLYTGALGTTHLVQAESGATVETHVSSAWGEPLNLPGTTDPAGRRAAFTFTGLRSLPGTGLLDARARFYVPSFYDPGVFRFGPPGGPVGWPR